MEKKVYYEARIRKRYDPLLYMIGRAGVSLSRMADIAFHAYAEGRRVKFLFVNMPHIPIQKLTSSPVHIRFIIKSQNALDLKKTIQPRLHAEFIKTLLMDSMVGIPLSLCMNEDTDYREREAIEMESSSQGIAANDLYVIDIAFAQNTFMQTRTATRHAGALSKKDTSKLKRQIKGPKEQTEQKHVSSKPEERSVEDSVRSTLQEPVEELFSMPEIINEKENDAAEVDTEEFIQKLHTMDMQDLYEMDGNMLLKIYGDRINLTKAAIKRGKGEKPTEEEKENERLYIIKRLWSEEEERREKENPKAEQNEIETEKERKERKEEDSGDAITSNDALFKLGMGAVYRG